MGVMSEADAPDAPAGERPAMESVVRALEAARNNEIALRKEAERERDAAALRAAEAARRTAIVRRDATEQRARAEKAEARAEEMEAWAEAMAAEAGAMAGRIRAELADAARERDALLGSTSWRITAPLRAASGWLPVGLRDALRSKVRWFRQRLRSGSRPA